MGKRIDEQTASTTLAITDLELKEADPTGTKIHQYITALNKIKGYFKLNMWEKVASVTNPDAGYSRLFVDASNQLWSQDESGNLRKLNNVRIFCLPVFGITDAVTTGNDKVHFDIPLDLAGMNLTYVMAVVDTVSSSGTPTIQIRNITDSVDMLSTLLTIDEGEYTSVTATVAAVIDGTKDDVAHGDRLAIDVDVAGTSTLGMRVYVGFQYP
jgi:hypothetical protein